MDGLMDGWMDGPLSSTSKEGGVYFCLLSVTHIQHIRLLIRCSPGIDPGSVCLHVFFLSIRQVQIIPAGDPKQCVYCLGSRGVEAQGLEI